MIDPVLSLSFNSSLSSFTLLPFFSHSCILSTDIYLPATVHYELCHLLKIWLTYSSSFYFSSFSHIISFIDFTLHSVPLLSFFLSSIECWNHSSEGSIFKIILSNSINIHWFPAMWQILCKRNIKLKKTVFLLYQLYSL